MGTAARAVAAAAASGLLALLLGATANARVEAVCAYTLDQTYSGALRYLRVDKGYDVVERDREAAYLLFRYVPPGHPARPTQGSIELVPLRQEVKVLVRLPEMAEFHEQLLRDELLRKLRQDYGEPRKPAGARKPRRPANKERESAGEPPRPEG